MDHSSPLRQSKSLFQLTIITHAEQNQTNITQINKYQTTKILVQFYVILEICDWRGFVGIDNRLLVYRLQDVVETVIVAVCNHLFYQETRTQKKQGIIPLGLKPLRNHIDQDFQGKFSLNYLDSWIALCPLPIGNLQIYIMTWDKRAQEIKHRLLQLRKQSTWFPPRLKKTQLARHNFLREILYFQKRFNEKQNLLRKLLSTNT